MPLDLDSIATSTYIGPLPYTPRGELGVSQNYWPQATLDEKFAQLQTQLATTQADLKKLARLLEQHSHSAHGGVVIPCWNGTDTIGANPPSSPAS